MDVQIKAIYSQIECVPYRNPRAILAFAKAMGEFGATITFVSNIPGQTQTLPSAIYAFLQVPGGEGAAAAMGLVALLRPLVWAGPFVPVLPASMRPCWTLPWDSSRPEPASSP